MSLLGDPATIADGNGILGHVFGSRDVSRQVAAHAAGQTGLSPDLLKQMLPMVAALVMGAMARHSAAGGRSTSGLPGPGLPGGGALGGALGSGGGDLISMITATLGQAGAMRGGANPGGGPGGGLGDLLGRFLGR